MPISPPDNGGFTVTSPGFMRVQLADDAQFAGSDLWVRPGERYPLKVIAYEFPSPQNEPGGLAFLPPDLGGFRNSQAYDDGPGANLKQGVVGFYVVGPGTIEVDGGEITMAAGDFYVGNPATVTFGTINFITAIW